MPANTTTSIKRMAAGLADNQCPCGGAVRKQYRLVGYLTRQSSLFIAWVLGSGPRPVTVKNSPRQCLHRAANQKLHLW